MILSILKFFENRFLGDRKKTVAKEAKKSRRQTNGEEMEVGNGQKVGQTRDGQRKREDNKRRTGGQRVYFWGEEKKTKKVEK